MKAQVRRRILIITVAAVVALGLVYGFLPKPVEVDKGGDLQLPLDDFDIPTFLRKQID